MKKSTSGLILFILVASLTSYFVANETIQHGFKVSDALFIQKVNASEVTDNVLVMTADMIRLEGIIDRVLAKEVKAQMLEKYVKNSKKPIHVLINSPGGSIVAGRQIFDIMEMVKNPIECHIVDLAASMAALIAMHCDKVYMTKSSILLFHQMSMSYSSYVQIRELKKDVKFWEEYWKEMIEETAVHMNMSYAELYDHITNTWMLTARQAKGRGLIDGFITAYKCDKQGGLCINPLFNTY